MLDDNNKNKSLGFELTYKPNSKISFDYNAIIGNEINSYDNNPKVRIFNDLYINYSPTAKLDLILGLDFAAQEKSKFNDSTATAYLYSTFLSCRYKITPKLFISARAEYFNDGQGILTGNIYTRDLIFSGLSIWGFTGALEYRPVENYYMRLESRFLNADKLLKIFNYNSNSRTEATINMGFDF